MAITPWLSSDDLINVIKRRCAIPLSQDTFTAEDLLDFVNGELYDSQVPSVMIVHNEYYVYRQVVPLVLYQNRYTIPDRAIGMKLRDLFYQDNYGNLKKMSRINPDNQDIYLTNNLVSTTPYMFFIENNDIVLTLPPQTGVAGNILMTFYLRPNKLVTNDNAFIVSSFSREIKVTNSLLNPGDVLNIYLHLNTYPANGSFGYGTPQNNEGFDENGNPVFGPSFFNPGTIQFTDSNNNDAPFTPFSPQQFTAVSASPSTNQFLIDITDIATATNLVNTINTNISNNYAVTASNGAPATNVVTLNYQIRNVSASSLSLGLAVSPNIILNSLSPVPSNIVQGSYIDFLQTKPGHKIYSYDIPLNNLTTVGSNFISVPARIVPYNYVIGDYVCLQYTCIIPQIPPELHSLLAERACSRLLSAQGDVELLQDVDKKVAAMEKGQQVLIDNRVEGSPQKVVNRNSLLNTNKYRLRSML